LDTRFRGLRFFVGITSTALAASIIVAAGGLPRSPFLGMSERGHTVGLVQAGGPAHRAGIEVGDHIDAVDGKPVSELSGWLLSLRSLDPGTPVRLSITRDGERIERILVPDRLPPAEVGWNLALAAAALIALFVGSMVLVKRVSVLTAVFCLICVALSHLLFFPYVPPAPLFAAAAGIVKLLLSAFFPSLFLHFFLLFPYERSPLRRHPRALRIPYTISAILFCLALAAGVQSIPGGTRDRLEVLSGALHSGAFALSLSSSAILFATAYVRTDVPSIRRKLRVALASTVAAVLPIAAVIVYYGLFPGRAIAVDRLAVIGLVLLPIGFGYSIVRHGVFDIEHLVKRSLVVTGVTAILVLFYFLSYFLLRALLHTITALSGTLVSIVAFLFVIVLFSPLRDHLQEIVERSVYPDRFEARRRLREFARNLPLLPDEGEIIRASLEAAARAFGVTRGAYFPEGEGRGAATFTWGIPHGVGAPLLLGPVIRGPVLLRGEPLLREEVEAELPSGRLPPDERATLNATDARVFAPIETRGRRFGVAVLGGRLEDDAYSGSDLEILDFLATQTALAMENAVFQREIRIKEAMERELEIAQSLQRELLPHTAPMIPGIQLAAVMLPCREVGGDYYDYVQARGGRISIAIGDVSGKGVPAALVMANVQALFRAEARGGIEPDSVLDAMNRRLCEMGRPDRFVSFFCGLLDPDQRVFRYSNAGHPPPLLVHENGIIERLETAGLLLGIQPEVRYPVEVIHLLPGDLILCFTDGIADNDADGTALRENQLIDLVCSLRRLPAETMIDRLVERIRRDPVLEDDTTLVILKAV
jgi:sigma-B regulation protein RsbU (phosphoserine phosphatase)